jgi:hypothetical protein
MGEAAPFQVEVQVVDAAVAESFQVAEFGTAQERVGGFGGVSPSVLQMDCKALCCSVPDVEKYGLPPDGRRRVHNGQRAPCEVTLRGHQCIPGRP